MTHVSVHILATSAGRKVHWLPQMIRKMYLGGLFFIICLATGTGQGLLKMELWDIEKGLSNRNVQYAARGPEGFLWIVTTEIEKFDGHQFIRYHKFSDRYHIPISNITTSFKFNDSLLVISDSRNLFAFNMLTGKTAPFLLPAGMPDDFQVINSIIVKDHHSDILMVTTSETSSQVHVIDSTWKYLFTHRIEIGTHLSMTLSRSCTNGPEGVIWLMDEMGDEILKSTSKGTTRFHYPFRNKNLDKQYRITYHPGLGLLVFQNNGQVDLLAEGDSIFHSFFNLDIVSENMSTPFIRRNGNIWLLMDDRFVIFDPAGKVVQFLPQQPFKGIKPTLNYIFEDDEGTTWYCTEIGILKVNAQANPFLSVLNQPPSERNVQFREIIPWNGPNRFVCRIAKYHRSIVEITFDGKYGYETRTLFDDVLGLGLLKKYNGYLYQVWSGNPVLYRYDVENQVVDKINLPISAVSDYRNQFLIDSSGRVHYFDKEHNITVFSLEDSSSTNLEIPQKDLISGAGGRTFNLRGDTYYYGTQKRGLILIDRETGEVTSHYNTDTNPALSGDDVSDLVFDTSNVLWLGTLGGGLNRLDLDSNSVHVFTRNDGLPNNLIASISTDRENHLWVGTYNGLARMDKGNFRFHNYFTGDGLPHNEFNYLASYDQSPDSILYIGTFNGLVRFRPGDVYDTRKLPRVALTRIQRYNRLLDEVFVREYGLSGLQEVTLSPNDNYLNVEFAVPSFNKTGEFKYFAKLQGVDDDFRDLGKNHFIRFQKLQPGKYTLLVKAMDANENESNEPLQLSIRVKQVFYKSWWFVSLVSLVLLALVYAIYRYRINMIRKEMQTRTRIASDLHDEIGSSLTRVSLQMQLMEALGNGVSGEGSGKLGLLSEIIDQASTKLRDVVWSVDARSDKWENITTRMIDYASDTLHPKGIDFVFETEGIQGGEDIPVAWKQNVYLIYKEAIHNISKHSNGENVRVHLKLEGKQFHMLIQDNGSPLKDTGRHEKGQGLANLKLRAQRISGKLDHGYNEQGYFVELTIDDR